VDIARYSLFDLSRGVDITQITVDDYF